MHLEQLGPYRLGKKLGQGGMGSVYAGVDTETGEAAAIKVLAAHLAGEEGFRARFEAEIESLKKLRHPNIVRLFGYGEQGGTLFYAMELVEGASLDDELRAGRRFDWREVTQIAIKVCRALKHAHDHGIIHRDIKPANLMLTPEGEIKLSDFGIARLFGNTRVTSDGGVLGTAEYMAPEQADGRTVTEKCDQYSLGGVMYALLTGRPPFRAKSLVEMLQLQRFAEPEPVTRYAPQTPRELAQVVQQLLEKEPNKRFPNTLILARGLEAMERGLSVSLSRGDDFVLGPGDAASGSLTDYNALSPTMTPTQLAEQQQLKRAATSDGNLQVTEATIAFSALGKPQDGQDAESPPPLSETAPDRFTKVEEERHDRGGELRELLAGLLAPQTLALALALVSLVGVGWYLMKTPSADSLYGDIQAATADGDPVALRASQGKIEAFLAAYPDDPRGEQLRELQDELKQAHPVQRAYTEAKRYRLINPDLTAAKLQALLDVYDGSDESDATRHYLKLARAELNALQKRIAKHVDDDQAMLRSRLTHADQLAGENPAAARKIYQGIVELYDGKPWAAEIVGQAKTALAAPAEERAASRP